MVESSNPPRISVVTPSYNQGAFLEATIRSVLDQNYPSLEYIVIDGGSTDESVKIIKKYQNRFGYWVCEKDRGQSNAINKGFSKATGDILCWLNSDDLFFDGTLDQVAKCFSDPDVMWCTGKGVAVDYQGNILYELEDLAGKDLKNWMIHYQHGKTAVIQPSTFWRRVAVEKIGPLCEDLNYAFDFEFFLRMRLEFGLPKRINQVLAGFRLHNNSKTCNSSDIFLIENLTIARKYLCRLATEDRNCILNWIDKERKKECFIRQQVAKKQGNYFSHYMWRLKGHYHRFIGSINHRIIAF